jgi:hypothetical protein
MENMQEKLTFEDISEFFNLSEELVATISDNMNSFSENELLNRLEVVENYLEEAIYATEVVSENYNKLMDESPEEAEKLKDEIGAQIVLMISSLSNCREEMIKKIGLNG